MPVVSGSGVPPNPSFGSFGSPTPERQSARPQPATPASGQARTRTSTKGRFIALFWLIAVAAGGLYCWFYYWPNPVNARVESLDFLESGEKLAPVKARSSQTKFARSKTRFVYWVVRLHHPQLKRRREFPVKCVLSRANGNVLTTLTHLASAKADQTWSAFW